MAAVGCLRCGFPENLAIEGEKRMGAMHDEEEELALNAKAIGLAIGGAIVAGLLFLLARRDDKKPVAAQVESAADAAAAELKRSGKEAKKKQKALKKAAEKQAREAKQQAQELVARAESNARDAERDMKAAAWDALQEARAADGKLRAAGSKVAGDAAHLASKLTHDAKSLAEEGKGRIGQLRHRDESEFSAQDEVARLREELALLREQAPVGRGARKDLSEFAAKLTRKSGLEPNSVAADALAAGLDQLERSLKAKAPELLAARDRRQVSALLQSELGPVLRDSLIQGATAALSSWEAARSATSDLPRPHTQGLRAAVTEAPKQVARALHRSGAAHEPELVSARNGMEDFAKNEVEAANVDLDRARASAEGETEAGSDSENSADVQSPAVHGKAGLLWGAAGLGLGIYALAVPARREQILKLANDATVLAQELLRDLQGYDDEFA